MIDAGQPLSLSGMKRQGSSLYGGPGKRSLKFMKAKVFDNRFDRGEDISKQLDLSRAIKPGREQKRVNVDLPVWMVQSLDKEAKRLGVTRQSIIKVWLAERLQHASAE
jgi:hypothetical protein